ncbi:hypothetical protein HKD37_07G019680 [Glycine soja]
MRFIGVLVFCMILVLVVFDNVGLVMNWMEITNAMIKINKKAEEMFNIVHVMDQNDELEPTWHLLHSSGNMHSVTYHQDLVSLAVLAGWTKLREFYGLTKIIRVFSSSSFSKAPLNQKFTLNDTSCTTKFLIQTLLKSS